jgi:hypothetical protein
LANLTDIVGLTTKDCKCINPNQPDGLTNVSLSGLYIDDPQYGIQLKDIQENEDCENGTVWEMLDKARSSGIRSVVNEYNIQMGRNAKPRHKTFRGEVIIDGSIVSNRNKTTYGTKILSLGAKGTYFKITSLGLKISTSETVSVDVSGTSVSIDTTANAITRAQNFNPITLKLTDSYGRKQDHVIKYSPSGSPFETKIFCKCTSKIPPWEKTFAQMRGFAIDTSDPVEADLVKKNGYGLIIDGHWGCDGLDWLTDSDIDFEINPPAAVLAQTIQLSQINALGSMLLSNNTAVNKITMYSQMEIKDILRRNMKIMENNFAWLSSPEGMGMLSQQLSSCYVCRPSAFKVGLKV